MNAGPTIAEALTRASARLGAGGDARGEAEWLLAHGTGRNRAWLVAHANDRLDAGSAAQFDALVARRARGEPVAQILGHWGFWSLKLQITPDVLIPRPETELLVERTLAVLPRERALRVADLGTGSGAIALALASERPRAGIVAVDASAAALQVAQANVQALGLSSRVHCVRGDWLQPLAGERFDAIVSNPPYIGVDDPHLRQGDLRFEPALALASGDDGLDAIRTIAAGAPAHLLANGWLLLEHGRTQGAAVRTILREAGFAEVVTHQDLEARDRVTAGCLPGPA